MKIYSISDLHLGNRNEKINKKFEEMLKDIVSSFSIEEMNLLLIPGDVFEYPLINNKTSKFLIDLANDMSSHLRIIITSGNHDISPLYKTSSLQLLEDVLNLTNNYEGIYGENSNFIDFQTIEDLPYLNIFSRKPTRIYIKDEKVQIDCLPYQFNGKGFKFDKNQKDFIKERDDYYKILMCHGCIEDFEISSDERDFISSSILKGYNTILKGHIHKVFNEKTNKYNIYSPGTINANRADAEGTILDIDHVNDKITFINLPENNFIRFKTFENLTPENVNKTLRDLNRNDSVSIFYTGPSEAINQDEYFRCVNDCVRFSFIYNDKDIIRGDSFKSIGEDKTFKGFYEYMDDFFEKSKSNDKMKEMYRNIKESINSKA